MTVINQESSGRSQNTFSAGSSKANVVIDPEDQEPVDDRSENTKRNELRGTRIRVRLDNVLEKVEGIRREQHQEIVQEQMLNTEQLLPATMQIVSPSRKQTGSFMPSKKTSTILWSNKGDGRKTMSRVEMMEYVAEQTDAVKGEIYKFVE